ncbi:hypothetical protein TO64_04790 [Citrobacter freundii]|nr:hypothetical protein TO64_04790 [Citrobacter freundii]
MPIITGKYCAQIFVNAHGQATRVEAVMAPKPNKKFRHDTFIVFFIIKPPFFVLIVLRMFRTLGARNIRRLRVRAAKSP